MAPSSPTRGRLFGPDRAPAQGETFDPIAHMGGARIEQITSSALPDQAQYDQDHDEWVLLLDGRATMEVEGKEVVLAQGEWLLLAAHIRHCVLRTEPGTRWLAVHAQSDLD